MGKIISCIFTVLIICCCFGNAGCENDRIEYTAEKPNFQFETEALENYEELIEKGEMHWTFRGCDPINCFKTYTEFVDYYLKNLKKDKIYLLYRYEEQPLIPPDYGSFEFYRDKSSGELIINESYDYYNEELGSKSNNEHLVGWKSVSVYFDVYIKACEKKDLTQLKLEFGKLEADYYGRNKYINIYSGEECFATCYYNNNVTIPREWFENYFKTNLIYGDEI